MPKMPTYDSNRQLTTQQPSVLTPENTDSKIMETATGAVEKTTDFATKWSEALDTIQTTTSKANTQELKADIAARGAADPNYNNLQKYIDEYDKVPENVTKGISKPAVKRMAFLESQHEINLAKIELQGIFKKKQIDVGQTNALRILDNLALNTGVSTDHKEKYIKNLLQEQAAKGIFSNEEAYKKEKEYLEKSDQNSYLADRAIDPEAADKKVQSGGYKNITPESRSRIVANIGALKAQDRYQMQLNEYDISTRIDNSDPAITPEYIDNMVGNNASSISPGSASQLKKSLYTARADLVKDLREDPNIDTNETKRYDLYSGAVSRIANKKEQYEKFGLMLKSFNDGELSNSERKNLDKILLGKDYVTVGEAFKTYIGNLTGALRNMMVNNRSVAVATADFVAKWANGTDPKQAQAEVLKQVADENIPGASLAKDSPNAVASSEGVTKAYPGDTTLKENSKAKIQTSKFYVGQRVKSKTTGKWGTITGMNPNGRYDIKYD